MSTALSEKRLLRPEDFFDPDSIYTETKERSRDGMAQFLANCYHPTPPEIALGFLYQRRYKNFPNPDLGWQNIFEVRVSVFPGRLLYKVIIPVFVATPPSCCFSAWEYSLELPRTSRLTQLSDSTAVLSKGDCITVIPDSMIAREEGDGIALIRSMNPFVKSDLPPKIIFAATTSRFLTQLDKGKNGAVDFSRPELVPSFSVGSSEILNP